MLHLPACRLRLAPVAVRASPSRRVAGDILRPTRFHKSAGIPVSKALLARSGRNSAKVYKSPRVSSCEAFLQLSQDRGPS